MLDDLVVEFEKIAGATTMGLHFSAGFSIENWL